MSQDEKVSRYEVNRNVRMVFTRHDADLSTIMGVAGQTFSSGATLVIEKADELQNVLADLKAKKKKD